MGSPQNEWLACIERLADSFLAGRAVVDPKPGACDWCHAVSVCRVSDAGIDVTAELLTDQVRGRERSSAIAERRTAGGHRRSRRIRRRRCRGRIAGGETLRCIAAMRSRVIAPDPRRSVLLQAPAGSGKTTVLTERLLRLLSEVDQPEEILAITFTRKAAAEMRARVLKALRGETDTSSAQGARMRKFADAALARATARGWDLAQDPGRLRIQTIDSFNFRLATQLTVTAKAGGSLQITERPGRALQPGGTPDVGCRRSRRATRSRRRAAL